MNTITVHTKLGSITNTMKETPIHIDIVLTSSNININIDLIKNSRDVW